jgi:hypothetical protein
MGIALRSVAFTRKTVTCAHHDRTAVGQIAVARAEVRLNCGESYGPSPECGQDEDRGVAKIETDLPRYGSTRVRGVFVGAGVPCSPSHGKARGLTYP